jgi:predicted metal-dependent hydrolase
MTTVSPQKIPVEIIRKPYLRTMKVRVRSNGLIQVICGTKVKETDIRRFLLETHPFIKKSFARLLSIQSKLPQPFSSEAPWVPWLGAQLPIIFDPDAKLPFIEEGLHIDKNHFNVDQVRAFYKKQAAPILEERLTAWSQTMQLFPKKLVLRGQKSRWGSCSSAGVINLNWKILIAPLAVIDYLIVHELAHLRHHNHSPTFWRLVEHFQPDYMSQEKWLKANQHLAEFLDPQSELYNPAVSREMIDHILLT